MLRGPGLTPHKIRAERSSNLSFQKLRAAGLTPHVHDERSSSLSGLHTTGSGPVRGVPPPGTSPHQCLSLSPPLAVLSWFLYI